MIDKLYELQKKLMDAHGGIEITEGGEPIEALPSLVNALIGITVESAEVLDELTKVSRTWKSSQDAQQNVKEELIDVYFYLLESFVLLGVTPDDMQKMYLEKYYWNLVRIARANEIKPMAERKAINILVEDVGMDINSIVLAADNEIKLMISRAVVAKLKIAP